MSRITMTVSTLVLSLGFTAMASAQHAGDIFLSVEKGKIITGEFDDDQGMQIDRRVFGATFGDSGFPEFTSSPGFDAPGGTFPVGTSIGFNALAGWTVWNGDGFEPAAGESLYISFGPLNVTVEDEPVEGFQLTVQSNGGWHRHYDYFILGPSGDNPLPGIYLLELELYNTSPNIQPTEPFWKVFNFGMPASVHDEAIAWVEDNLLDDDCPGDINDDGTVDGLDLLILLGEWGECPGDCSADLNGDGAVDGLDLLIFLSSWGECP